MFYYQYFIRAPIVPNMSLVIGSAAHSAVEALFSSNLKGNPLSMEQMREIYTKEIDRSLLAGNERAYRDALERGRDFLSKYYLYRADSLPKNIFIEYDFRSHAVHLDGIRLTGKLDMVEITDRIAKRCTIYDFKTGSAKNGIEKVAAGKDIWRQVVFYKMLTQLSSRFGYVMDRGIIEFIEPYTDGTFETVELIVSDADVDVVKQQIREMWDGLQRLNFACLDESGECQYCENILRVGDGLD
jgi:DNA helicase-2/ATP-dependent DNA helicase PcrA